MWVVVGSSYSKSDSDMQPFCGYLGDYYGSLIYGPHAFVPDTVLTSMPLGFIVILFYYFITNMSRIISSPSFSIPC